jgi:hypothetical protein
VPERQYCAECDANARFASTATAATVEAQPSAATA